MPLNEGAVSDILPFAPDGQESAGDLLPLAEYQADTMRLRGHQPGIARRSLENRVLRQVAHVAAGLAQFVANRHAPGMVDDGDLDKVEAGLVEAVEALAAALVAVEAAARQAHEEDMSAHWVDRVMGLGVGGAHESYAGDLDTIAHNSGYAAQQGVALHLPPELPADAWAVVQTMILPGGVGGAQLAWHASAPGLAGWWRVFTAGTWSEWDRLVTASDASVRLTTVNGCLALEEV